MATYAPEDIVNQALVEIGYPERIAEMSEGSLASRAAIEVYAQTRDELLRGRDWPFVRRKIVLTLLKGPPPPGGYTPATPWTMAYPPPGWLYEYAYPGDCLRLGAIVPAPGMMPALDPRPASFRIDNDNTLTPPQKVILTNLGSAIAIYDSQITDPGTWEPAFVTALVKALAGKLAKLLTPGQLGAAEGKEELVEAGAAAMGDSRKG